MHFGRKSTQFIWIVQIFYVSLHYNISKTVMQVKLGYRYRLLPNDEQVQFLERSFGCARLVYNLYVSYMYDEIKKRKEDKTYKIQPIPEVSLLKKKFPFLSEVDSLALANVKLNFQSAWKNYFDSKKGKRKGRKVNPPEIQEERKM